MSVLHKNRIKAVIFVIGFLCSATAHAMEIYLKNGDKVTGVIIRQDHASLVLKTPEAGVIKLDKSFIDLSKTYPQIYPPPPPVPPPPVLWKNNFSLGYTQAGGNTRKQLGQASISLDHKTVADEASFKYDAFYSSSNGLMDGKKFDGMARYAFSFGHHLKWYNFYELDANEDRFADIYYRLDPSIGVGYWFSDTDNLKAMAELGVGYEYTDYYGTTKSEGGPVMVPRFLVDKRLIGRLHLSEECTFYPSLENFNDYHFKSETDLINQITDHWAIKISFVDEFNSDPPDMVKKNDYTSIASLNYSF